MSEPEPSEDDLAFAIPTVQVVPGGRVDGAIRPPGSKSLTNRALICAAFTDSPSVLHGALKSEDTEVMIEALSHIGAEIESRDNGRTLQISRCVTPAGADGQCQELFIGNSGTSVRFLTAALSACGGHYRLQGVDRMHQRPIRDLVDAIAAVIDGQITAQSPGGCPPVLIRSRGWEGHHLQVAGSVSSQYLSGLMMAAPIALATSDRVDPVQIEVTGTLVSRPYVEMTADVMRSFGADVTLSDSSASGSENLVVEITSHPYRGRDYTIEPDASAASYFWAVAAISGGSVTVEGLSDNAMQGDVGFCDVLEQMGCEVRRENDSLTVTGKPLRGIDVDMNAISDTVQTLAVVALFADGPTRVRGVAHNRFKETDRIGDLACELRKLGAEVTEHDDGMTITPPAGRESLHGAILETYHDHRMAMSLSLAGLRVDGVRVRNPSCTAKTYPEFFSDLEKLLGRPHRWGERI